MKLKIGDQVVYPNQGVARLEQICERTIAGRLERFFLFRVLANNSTVMIPVSNVGNVGLRQLSSDEKLEELFEVLRVPHRETETDWKNRYKENVEKMRTGCILQVGQVLQSLYFVSFQKPLSFREKKMYDRARQLVVSEVATVRGQDKASAESLVETLLQAASASLSSHPQAV